MNYKDQLLTDEWKARREEILNRDNYECQLCKERTNLHIHHFYYVGFLKAWEYPDDSLITYCEICHTKWHEYKTQIDQLLKVDFIDLSLIKQILAILITLKSTEIGLIRNVIDEVLNFGFNLRSYGDK